MRIGKRLPLDKGAPGKVILAFMGEKGKEYERIRQCGYHISIPPGWFQRGILARRSQLGLQEAENGESREEHCGDCLWPEAAVPVLLPIESLWRAAQDRVVWTRIRFVEGSDGCVACVRSGETVGFLGWRSGMNGLERRGRCC